MHDAPVALRRSVAVLALLLLPLAACVKERRFLIMEDLEAGTALGADRGVEVVGEVEGEAHFRQLLTLFADSNLRGVQGSLLSSTDHALLEERLQIPVLDPLLARIAALLNGTTRVGTAQRVAMGRAILAANELGADTLLAPRVEVVTRSLTFVVPLGWLYSSGVVEVKAKAVRLGRAAGEADDAP